jgi:hypothetical protein
VYVPDVLSKSWRKIIVASCIFAPHYIPAADSRESRRNVWLPSSGQATFRFEHALARGREFRKLRRRPDRPPQQFAAAIRAVAFEDAFGAGAAEGSAALSRNTYIYQRHSKVDLVWSTNQATDAAKFSQLS